MDYVHRQRSSHPIAKFCFFLSVTFALVGFTDSQDDEYEYDVSVEPVAGGSIVSPESTGNNTNDTSTFSEFIQKYKFVIAGVGGGVAIIAVVGVVVYFKCVRKEDKGKGKGKGKHKRKHKRKSKREGSKKKSRKKRRRSESSEDSDD